MGVVSCLPVYDGWSVYHTPMGRFPMVDISSVGIVTVPRRSVLETSRLELSEDASFGIGTLLVVAKSSMENRPSESRGGVIYTVVYGNHRVDACYYTGDRGSFSWSKRFRRTGVSQLRRHGSCFYHILCPTPMCMVHWGSSSGQVLQLFSSSSGFYSEE